MTYLLSALCMLNRFNALNVATGEHREGSPTAPVAASRTFPDSDFPNNATTFVAIKQLQRPGDSKIGSPIFALTPPHAEIGT